MSAGESQTTNKYRFWMSKKSFRSILLLTTTRMANARKSLIWLLSSTKRPLSAKVGSWFQWSPALRSSPYILALMRSLASSRSSTEAINYKWASEVGPYSITWKSQCQLRSMRCLPWIIWSTVRTTSRRDAPCRRWRLRKRIRKVELSTNKRAQSGQILREATTILPNLKVCWIKRAIKLNK